MEATNKKQIGITIDIGGDGIETQISTDNVNAIEMIGGYVSAANSLAEVIARNTGGSKEHVLRTMATALFAIADDPALLPKTNDEEEETNA